MLTLLLEEDTKKKSSDKFEKGPFSRFFHFLLANRNKPSIDNRKTPQSRAQIIILILLIILIILQ